MIIKKFFKKKINDFIYISSVFLISFFIINIYKLNSNKSIERSDPGFGAAMAINNSKDLCIISKENINCQKNLLSELKSNKQSILFLGNSQMGAINEFSSGDYSFVSLFSCAACFNYLGNILRCKCKKHNNKHLPAEHIYDIPNHPITIVPGSANIDINMIKNDAYTPFEAMDNNLNSYNNPSYGLPINT